MVVYNVGMSVISGISIDNFRGLRDFQLKGARRFNLLVGPSEIGKTSVLEAINLSSGASQIRNCLPINRSRGAIVENRHDAALAVASLFHNFQQSTVTLSAAVKVALGMVNIKTTLVPIGGHEIAHKDADIPDGQQGDLAQTDAFTSLKCTTEFTGAARGRGHQILRINDNGVKVGEYVQDKQVVRANKKKEAALSEDELSSLRLNTSFVRKTSIQTAVREATRNKKKAAVLDVVRKINPHIVDFAPDGERKPPLVDIGLDTMVSSHILGDGVRNVVGMLGMLCSKDHKVHLEDEIGSGVYFGSQALFLRAALLLAKQEGKQIFATTHNKDILIALQKVLAEEEDLRDDVAVFSFMPNKHKKITATPYLYEDIDRCIENGVEIR